MFSRLTGIEALDIANTQVTDNGLDYLITLTNLKELAIGRSRLGDNALEVSAQCCQRLPISISAAPELGRRTCPPARRCDGDAGEHGTGARGVTRPAHVEAGLLNHLCGRIEDTRLLGEGRKSRVRGMCRRR